MSNVDGTRTRAMAELFQYVGLLADIPVLTQWGRLTVGEYFLEPTPAFAEGYGPWRLNGPRGVTTYYAELNDTAIADLVQVAVLDAVDTSRASPLMRKVYAKMREAMKESEDVT